MPPGLPELPSTGEQVLKPQIRSVDPDIERWIRAPSKQLGNTALVRVRWVPTVAGAIAPHLVFLSLIHI